MGILATALAVSRVHRATAACVMSLLIGTAVRTASLGAQEVGGDADGEASHSGRVVDAVDRFVEAFNRGDSSALGAAFNPRAKVFEFYLGEDRLAEAEWLDVPWRYHAIQVPPGWTGELRVLQRLVSGSFVTQRERLGWTAPDGRTGKMIRTATYQVRGDRIHRLWLLPDEPDPARVPTVPAPTYPAGNGPTVWVDAWHWNTGTPDLTFWSFAELLRRDGYAVRAWQAPFARAALDSVGILVVVNAQPEPDADARRPLPLPSAFTSDEIDAVRSWVSDGGSLLLVADHEPFAGAAAQLAAIFGAEFHDGAAVDTTRRGGGGDVFRREDGTLRPHPVTDGRSAAERVNSVATFRGQAFRGSEALVPILVLPDAMVLSVPDSVPPNRDQPRHVRPVGGWLQAGVRPFGEGRVAIFGEAWMFRFFNDPSGRGPQTQNAQLILNLMRWLSSVAPPGPWPGDPT